MASNSRFCLNVVSIEKGICRRRVMARSGRLRTLRLACLNEVCDAVWALTDSQGGQSGQREFELLRFSVLWD